MNTLTFLLSTVIELYTMALLLRVWMQWSRCDFYNPFSQFIVKITQPIIGPLRRIIPDGTDRQRISISRARSQLYQSHRAV